MQFDPGVSDYLVTKVAVLLTTLLASIACASTRTITVCEADRISQKLDGRTARIRGVWRRSFPKAEILDELVDERCPTVEIHVVTSEASLPHPRAPQGYKLDKRSAGRAQRVAEKAIADGRELSVTIVGVLYVQKKEDYVPARPLNKDVMIPPHHKWSRLVLLIQAIPEVNERR